MAIPTLWLDALLLIKKISDLIIPALDAFIPRSEPLPLITSRLAFIVDQIKFQSIIRLAFQAAFTELVADMTVAYLLGTSFNTSIRLIDKVCRKRFGAFGAISAFFTVVTEHGFARMTFSIE